MLKGAFQVTHFSSQTKDNSNHVHVSNSEVGGFRDEKNIIGDIVISNIATAIWFTGYVKADLSNKYELVINTFNMLYLASILFTGSGFVEFRCSAVC